MNQEARRQTELQAAPIEEAVAEWRRRHEVKALRVELESPCEPLDAGIDQATRRLEMAVKFVHFALDDLQASYRRGEQISPREIAIVRDRLDHVSFESHALIEATESRHRENNPEGADASDIASTLQRAFSNF